MALRMFGLAGMLGVLVAAAIWLHVELSYDSSVIKAGRQATHTVQKMTNGGGNGMRADASIVLAPVETDGKLTAARVVSVVAGGPMQADYGFMAGDVITFINDGQLGHARIGQFDLSDFDTVKAMMFSPHPPDRTYTIQRGGATLTLPTSAASPSSPSAPSPPVRSPRTTLQQLQGAGQ